MSDVFRTGAIAQPDLIFLVAFAAIAALVLAVSWRVVVHIARVTSELERFVLGGAVGAIAIATRALAWIVVRADVAIVDGAFFGAATSIASIGDHLRRSQGMRLRRHAGSLARTLFAFVLLYYMFLKR